MLERRYTLPENPHILVHPSRTARSGKFDCTVMSLSLLLDYRQEDTKVSTMLNNKLLGILYFIFIFRFFLLLIMEKGFFHNPGSLGFQQMGTNISESLGFPKGPQIFLAKVK